MVKQNKKVPELRFKGFTDDWEQRKLNSVTERVIRKNKNLESELPLTISAQYGLIDQLEFFNKTVASRDVSGYYLVKNGEFAYNKSYSNGYPWGAIKRLDRYDKGVLSTLYILFKPIDVDSDFLAKYYDTTNWYKEVSMRAAEGARNHGLLNIAPSDFFETQLIIPVDKNEQYKIGRLFIMLDSIISLHKRKLEKLKLIKQAYLQVIFPENGKSLPGLRFAGFNGDWKQQKLGDITQSYSGGTPTSGKSEYYGGSIPFIRSAEINKSSTELYLTQEGLENSSAKMVEIGNILYALYGAISGEVGISKINGAINQAILSITPNDGYVARFIMQWLRMQKQQITDTYLQGGQGNLSGNLIKDLVLNVPCKDEQIKVAKLFDRLDALISIQNNKIYVLQKLKQAYLQKMFI